MGKLNSPEFLLLHRTRLADKIRITNIAASTELNKDSSVYSRIVASSANATTSIFLPESGTYKSLTMFGSNNYLGLAFDDRVLQAARQALTTYGAGTCGSAVLNGNSTLQRELEEATADLKGMEDCLIFSSGFSANFSWASALPRSIDTIYCDREAHMSFRAGAKNSGAKLEKFEHNSPLSLNETISLRTNGEKYVFVESLYSMRGDMPKLETMYKISQKHGGIFVVDDAHGTGTMGATGRGGLEGISHGSDVISVGTYSKALGSTGGFICGTRDIINCLRVLAPAYMFSASLAPASMAAALAAIKILLDEPQRVAKLIDNCLFASNLFRRYDNISSEQSPIIYLKIGDRFDPLRATKMLENMGCFVNPVSFPAVGRHDSGIRISISSEHTKEQLTYLEHCINHVWDCLNNQQSSECQ
jgi:glycine C-acetyltransferase